MLGEELIAAISEWDLSVNGHVDGRTPLISSARLDSLNLLRLLLWIEEKVGRSIDATTVDLTVEWDTVDDIVAFVEQEQRRR